MFNPRLGCSSISFRHLDLPNALQTMGEIGFEEIDLGALPGVCNHVPYALGEEDVRVVSAQISASGLNVRSVNGDIGDLNAMLGVDAQKERDGHLEMLLALAVETGAKALVLPCGALNRDPLASLDADLDVVASSLARAQKRADAMGIELWTEALHYFRLCSDMDRAGRLIGRLAGSGVGSVMDFSHIVASGADPLDFIDRFHGTIAHVHLRDAVPGNINLSIGNGETDFAAGLTALQAKGYAGHFSLELETRDVADDERPTAAAQAATHISTLI